jgi:hypothetical protein
MTKIIARHLLAYFTAFHVRIERLGAVYVGITLEDTLLPMINKWSENGNETLIKREDKYDKKNCVYDKQNIKNVPDDEQQYLRQITLLSTVKFVTIFANTGGIK